jgi:hypothetical protein
MRRKNPRHNARRAKGSVLVAAMLPLCVAFAACGGSSSTPNVAARATTVTQSAVSSAACAREHGLSVGKHGEVLKSPNVTTAAVEAIMKRCGIKLPPKVLHAKVKAVSDHVTRVNQFAACVRRNRGAIPLPAGKSSSLSTAVVKRKTARVRNAVRVCQHLLE